MGEVYRARDTTLDRDVAIKILPQDFTADPKRLARFEREARLLAALNHPHIAAIHGIVDAAGVRGLVLELVEGETLADRILRGPAPLTDALTIARQIADAAGRARHVVLALAREIHALAAVAQALRDQRERGALASSIDPLERDQPGGANAHRRLLDMACFINFRDPDGAVLA